MPYLGKEEREMGWRRIHTRRKRIERKRKRGSAQFACLEEEEMGPRKAEISESEVNYACKHINLANGLGGNDWARKTGRKNVVALSIQVLMGGGLRIFSWLGRYVEYSKAFTQNEII